MRAAARTGVPHVSRPLRDMGFAAHFLHQRMGNFWSGSSRHDKAIAPLPHYRLRNAKKTKLNSCTSVTPIVT